jgi:hypothetical protein
MCAGRQPIFVQTPAKKEHDRQQQRRKDIGIANGAVSLSIGKGQVRFLVEHRRRLQLGNLILR